MSKLHPYGYPKGWKVTAKVARGKWKTVQKVKAKKRKHRRHPILSSFRAQLIARATQAERKFKVMLDEAGIGHEFQKIIPLYRNPFIVDFYIPRNRLIVEIDGEYHNGRKAYDSRREWILRKRGFSLIRFQNREVFENPVSVMERLTAIMR